MSRTVFPALPSQPAHDVLCGGPPLHMARCGLCAVVKGPYYDVRLARDAVREHVRWRHETGGHIDMSEASTKARP